jgi:hypothetical protein
MEKLKREMMDKQKMDFAGKKNCVGTGRLGAYCEQSAYTATIPKTIHAHRL